MSFGAQHAKSDYKSTAVVYNDYASLPLGHIESQLIAAALGDCNGLTVLDLGGGTGVHAREAVAMGASAVDVVDISAEMLKARDHLVVTV